MAIYQNAAEIKTDVATAAKCAEESPKGVVLAKKDTVKVVDIQAFNRSPTCASLLKGRLPQGPLEEDEFVFTVESTGALPPEKIVSEAVKVLNAKLEELKRKVDADELHEEIRGLRGTHRGGTPPLQHRLRRVRRGGRGRGRRNRK